MSILLLATLFAAEPASPTSPVSPTASVPLAARYGFLSPEIYKLDQRTKNLLLRDINGDGKLDIIVVNNLKNRIDVLLQRKPGEKPTRDLSVETNEVPEDWRLEHKKIPSSRSVSALEVKDVDSDGKADLVYLGDPPGLYVEYQSGELTFDKKRRFDAPDVQQSAWMVDVGDINGDKRNDIAFLGKEYLYLVYQGSDGKLEEPRRYRLAEGGGSLIRILDFDGDGRNDITYQSEDKQHPVRIRFQTRAGRLGAERRFAIDPTRGVSFAEMDHKPGEEMLAISEPTDRLIIYTLAAARADDSPTGKFVVFPFEKSGSSLNNDLVSADVDGDGLVDVVVSDPDAARLLLYSQSEKEGLDVAQAFPGLAGSLLRAVEVAGGVPEILCLSEKESTIGATHFEKGRLVFPVTVPTKDDPVAMEVVSTGNESLVMYVAKVSGSGGASDKFFLRAIRPKRGTGAVEWSPAKFGDKEELALDFSGKPSDIRAVDANGDGRLDLMFFFAFQPPAVWLANEKNGFVPSDKVAQGSLRDVSPAGVAFAPLAAKEPVLLVVQNNFARGMRLEQNRWKVLDQFTANTSGAAVSGVAVIDLDGDGKNEIALYDRAAKGVVFLKEKDGLYRNWKQLDVGSFALRGMRVGDYNGDHKPDLLLFDNNQMGIAYAAKPDRELKEIASYETQIRKGKLFDMVPGDLNSDGKLDILLLEPLMHHLEIVAWEPEGKIRRAIAWRVFEEKTFRQASRSNEPREAVIGDVDGDGRNDIVVLCHDRVLVYPQDGGPTATPDKKAELRSN